MKTVEEYIEEYHRRQFMNPFAQQLFYWVDKLNSKNR